MRKLEPKVFGVVIGLLKILAALSQLGHEIFK
jgi:hypothetical protein